MPTGSQHVDIYNKQMVPQEGWDQYFFRYLDAKVDESTRSSFLSAGVLSDQAIDLTSTSNDTFEVDISNASRGVNDSGQIMDLSLTPSEEIEDIAFENTSGITYYTGFRFQEVPTMIERNPRSSEPEYPFNLDSIGELGDPDSVVDGGTEIRLDIDGILEAGVDHKNQLVRVWLDNPVSPVNAVAYFDGLVEYDGTNYVEIPYTPTAGPLGQTAPTFLISTTASDYTVHVRGLSWFRNTDISTDNDYVFLGTVQGSGIGTTPTVFDVSNQRQAFLISLDRAYRANSTGDPAPGRTIFADKKAVRIQQSATVSGTEDWFNQAFRIDQMDQGGAFVGGGGAVLSGYMGAGGFSSGISHYLIVSDGVGNWLETSEVFAGLTGTATAVLSRVGVDLTKFQSVFSAGNVICEITGTTSGLYDGFYFIDDSSILTDRLDIMTPDFAPVVFPVDTSGQIRILGMVNGTLIGDWFGPTSHDDFYTHIKNFNHYTNGLSISMMDNPIDPGNNDWFSCGCQVNVYKNKFAKMFAGRLLMRGGGEDYVGYPWRNDIVSGHAQITVDKIDISDLNGDWQPTEVNQEWGFDYRGAHFDKYLSGEIPGFQLGNTFRMPLWSYNGGSDEYTWDEPATVPLTDVLNFTAVGFDCTEMPFSVGESPNSVILEVEFASPYEADSGIYFAYEKVTTKQIRVQKIDGSSPVFNVAATATVRFFGGVFVGAVDSSNITGGTNAFLLNITSPNTTVGGIRYTHRADDAIGSTDRLYAMYLANVDSAMFSIRDGGIAFARAITTKSPWLTGKLTQWDQIDSSYYTGELAQIVQIDLAEDTYDVALPVSPANCNVFKRIGGSNWTVTKALNIFKIASAISGGIPAWVSPTGGDYLTCGISDVGGKIPFIVPQGAIINKIELYVDPITGDGTANSFGVEIKRKAFASISSTSLMSTGMLYTSVSTLQTLIVATDQNETIDNNAYEYWIEIRGSNTAGDLLYSARMEYEISKLGENLFDCF